MRVSSASPRARARARLASARARIPRAAAGRRAKSGARCRRDAIAACSTSGARATRSTRPGETRDEWMRLQLSAWAQASRTANRRRRRTPRDGELENDLHATARRTVCDAASSDSTFRHAASRTCADSRADDFASGALAGAKSRRDCRSEPTAPQRSAPAILTATHEVRIALHGSDACVATVVVRGARGQPWSVLLGHGFAALAWLMSAAGAAAALCDAARAGRAGGRARPRWRARRRAGAGSAALRRSRSDRCSPSSFGCGPRSGAATRRLARCWNSGPAGRRDMAGATGLMFAAHRDRRALHAVAHRASPRNCSPSARGAGTADDRRPRSSACCWTARRSRASDSDRMPSPLPRVRRRDCCCWARSAQRGDAGWLSVLLSPSAAGSSARGIIAWTILAPLALALLALAGVRAGLLQPALRVRAAGRGHVLRPHVAGAVERGARRTRAAARRQRARRDAARRQSPAAREVRHRHADVGVAARDARMALASTAKSGSTPPPTNTWKPGSRAACATARPSSNSRCAGRIDDPGCSPPAGASMRDQRAASIVGITIDITERKRAALALEASETRLQLAARALPGFVYDWNCASGKILRTSGIEQMLGFQRRGDLAREPLVGGPGAPRRSRAARCRRAWRAPPMPGSDVDSIACEYRVRHKHGRYVWIWDHCVLVRDRAGAVIRVVGSVLDITERKEAEARLATSEHRFKAALLATTGIIWTHSARRPRASANRPAGARSPGQSSDELQGLGWTRRAASRRCRRRRSTPGRMPSRPDEDLITVQRVRRRDGVYRTFSVHAVPVTDERGEIVEWVGSHTDITEQRDAEQRVRDSLQRLELALDAASVGMWDWDLDTGRMTWTRADPPHHRHQRAEQFTGRAEQFFGLLLPPDCRSRADIPARHHARRTRCEQSELADPPPRRHAALDAESRHRHLRRGGTHAPHRRHAARHHAPQGARGRARRRCSPPSARRAASSAPRRRPRTNSSRPSRTSCARRSTPSSAGPRCCSGRASTPPRSPTA